MSIVACVKVYDGIALGADSATQITGRDPSGNVVVLKVYQNARKLFQFQQLPVGILTYGIGNLGNKSIETLLREYNGNHPIVPTGHFTVSEIADNMLEFFQTLYNQQFGSLSLEQRPVLGFYIAGYSKGTSMAPLGEEYEFILPRDSNKLTPRTPDKFGASWRGISVPFTRLYFGYDPRSEEKLNQMGRQDVIPIINELRKEFGAKIIYDGMPIIDAIKFVHFILQTTIGLAYFEIGATSCSEPIDLAVIRDGKFEWVKEKRIEV